MTVHPSKIHRRLAHAITKNAEQSAQRHVSASIGTVIDTDPFQVELHDKPHVLTAGDDLLLSVWVNYYDQEIGIQVGDNAIIDVRHGVYVWSDILSDEDISGGMSGPPSGPAGGDLGGSFPNPTVAQISGHASTEVVFTGDSRMTNSRTPTGPAGGALNGTYPNPGLAISSLPPTGPAGGALNGTYPNPGLAITSLPPTGPAGGDLAGTYPNPTLAAPCGFIQMHPVSWGSGTTYYAGNSVYQAYTENGVTIVDHGTGRGYDLVAPRNGLYEIQGCSRVDAGTTVGWTYAEVSVLYNGSAGGGGTYGYAIVNLYAGSATYGTLAFSKFLNLNAGDTINAQFQNGGVATFTTQGAPNFASDLSLRYVGPKALQVI